MSSRGNINTRSDRADCFPLCDTLSLIHRRAHIHMSKVQAQQKKATCYMTLNDLNSVRFNYYGLLLILKSLNSKSVFISY